jgi:hypothetical protein
MRPNEWAWATLPLGCLPCRFSFRAPPLSPPPHGRDTLGISRPAPFLGASWAQAFAFYPGSTLPHYSALFFRERNPLPPRRFFDTTLPLPTVRHRIVRCLRTILCIVSLKPPASAGSPASRLDQRQAPEKAEVVLQSPLCWRIHKPAEVVLHLPLHSVAQELQNPSLTRAMRWRHEGRTAG